MHSLRHKDTKGSLFDIIKNSTTKIKEFTGQRRPDYSNFKNLFTRLMNLKRLLCSLDTVKVKLTSLKTSELL